MSVSYKWVGFTVIVLFGFLLIHNCRLSFCQSDESFYLALVHRLWNGDRLILDEWHPVQFYAPILLPFYSLYRAFVPDGTGVYLYARIIYVLFSVTVGLKIYFFCQKEHQHWCIGLVATLLCILYSRANIRGPSYYNLCMLFCVLTVLFLSDTGKRELLKYICSGIFCAFAVLCNPHLGVFVVLGGLVGVLCVPKLRGKLLFMSLGVLIAACIYCFRHIRFSELSQILESFSYILSDPAHISIHDNIILAVDRMKYWGSSAFCLALVGCLFILLSYLGIIGQQAYSHFRIIYLSISFVLLAKTALASDSSICYVISLPFSLLVLPFVLKAFLYRTRLFELNLYFTGIILAVAFLLASNTGLDAMTSGFCISSIAGALLLAPNSEKVKAANMSKSTLTELALFACIYITIIGVFSAHRFVGVYRDAPADQLTEQIKEGPAAGLYTTAEHAAQYNSIHKKIYEISATYPDAGVLFSKILPWAYLSGNLKCASFTSWAVPMDDERLIPYYSEHPMPELVFIFSENVGEFSAAKFNNHVSNGSYNRNSFGGQFYDYVLNNGNLIEDSGLIRIYLLEKQSRLDVLSG